MLRTPRRSGGRPATVATLTLGLSAALAFAVPGAASAASRPCPGTGTTVAVSRTDDGASRVWRTRGRTYGCTTIGNDAGRPDSHLLSRGPIGRVRLDGATLAWTHHAKGTPKRARRVSAMDLMNGSRFLDRRRARPAEDLVGSLDREASVEQLRVLRGNAVGWIADRSTVVIAVEDPDDVALVGAPEGTGEIHLSGAGSGDGYAGVAAGYPSTPEGDRSLRTSLRIAEDPDVVDDDDEGRYGTIWSWSPDGSTTVRAELTGTRD
ncbi:hypothetical protein [Patulibacter sp.]|uniref:hypothetical protein n=1 Tax=Patulibacter sp. TaxID=1912859 RepID=UPI0027210DD3|nr:hypothetical protein [Patulibacter sp.]MDO9408208.1 hypothetical protein [Patulibacter sp.]